MQSRCKAHVWPTRTWVKIFARTWVKIRYCSFEQVSVALCTPLPEKGCVASNMPNAVFGLGLLLGLSG